MSLTPEISVRGTCPSLRVLVHDYSGHPFQVQLSRALARRGHEVLHAHCASYRTGKGALEPRPGDPDRFQLYAVDGGEDFDRYAVIPRCRHELSYGARFNSVAAAFQPQVIVSSNDPLLAKARSAGWCWRTRTPWVYWLQDLYSVGMAKYAESKFGPAGVLLGRLFDVVEGNLLRQANAVVEITADFQPKLRRWKIPEKKCHVIENWAPLEELPVREKDNPWACEHHLDGCFVFLYAGTLGLKHDPRLITALAHRFRDRSEAKVVVVSEGRGADWLRQAKSEDRLDNLLVLPYQPFDRLPEVLGAADVLLALLSGDAGQYSVPSKVLTYLCAGRPIIAAMPQENMAARTIERSEAGVVVPSGDKDGFVGVAEKLKSDRGLRNFCGQRARTYAERTFDIGAIARCFEAILVHAVGPSATDPRSEATRERR